MKRRALFVSTAVAVPLTGCLSAPAESGNIQIANQTGQEVWKEIAVREKSGTFSDSATVYDTRTRTPPTEGYRSTLTDVAPPGTYEVQVAFEAVESAEESGVHTTQWAPTGEKSEALIISLAPDFGVEFLTQ